MVGYLFSHSLSVKKSGHLVTDVHVYVVLHYPSSVTYKVVQKNGYPVLFLG